jgi:hypothetical protein
MRSIHLDLGNSSVAARPPRREAMIVMIDAMFCTFMAVFT